MTFSLQVLTSHPMRTCSGWLQICGIVDVEFLFALLWWSLPFFFFFCVGAISLTHELMISTEGFNHQARL